MDSINVECRSRSYDVIVGSGIEDMLFELVGEKESVVVTDSEVYALYKDRIKSVLPASEVFIVRSGERSKSENVLFDLIEFMIEKEIDRSGIIVAIGGGVVGDLAGFAASIYLRGIEYIQVPTTLLAQVDSSIGGKTAINVDNVKNAIGTFYQPKSVVCDVDFLDTLEEKEIISGLGEIIKTACLDEELFEYVEEKLEKLKKLDKEIVMEVVERCVKVKAEIVSQDERENCSIRNQLNLGHTLAHAMEITAKFMPKSHGEYVLIGIYYEAEIADMLERIDTEYKIRLQNMIIDVLGEKPELIGDDRIVENAMKDKKNHDGLISLIIPVDIGEASEVRLPEEQLEDIIEKLCD